MDTDDGRRPRKGVVVSLLDLGDGVSRVIMDDVTSDGVVGNMVKLPSKSGSFVSEKSHCGSPITAALDPADPPLAETSDPGRAATAADLEPQAWATAFKHRQSGRAL